MTKSSLNLIPVKIMMNLSRYSLLFFVLLGSCGGCQQRTDQAIQAQVPSCLIATQTTKELVSSGQQSQLELETVTVEGESFQVSTVKKSAYSYDRQGRILTEYNQYLEANQIRYGGGRADSVFYHYTPTAVSIRTVTFTDSSKIERTYSVALDSRGFAEKQPTTNLATYDKDGYLTTLRDEYSRPTANIDNGNMVEYRFGNISYGSIYITKNEYDLSKPSLPSIISVYGKVSRNLLIRSVIDENTGHVLFSNVYTSTYTYTFDKNGRILRQISRRKDGEPGFIYGVNTVETIDYTYTCP